MNAAVAHAVAPSASLELSVVIPCLNEAETVAVCVGKAIAWMARAGVAGEVIVADNGSTDGSQALATAAGARVVPVEDRGYGAALAGGIAAASGRYVIMGDADDTYDFGALDGFLERLRAGDDLVMGNRFAGGIEKGAMPFLHSHAVRGVGRHDGARRRSRGAHDGVGAARSGRLAGEVAAKPQQHGKPQRHGVALSSLDDELFAGSGVRKRGLIDYLDAIADRFVPVLRDRPVSVVRTTGDEPFMQKNLPKYTPEWVERATMWAEASNRDVHYGVVNDVRTLMWFGNQRAVEYHVPLSVLSAPDEPTHLVVDLDPPAGEGPDGAATGFAMAVDAARLVRSVLDDAGLASAVKTSGSKGVHVVVPVSGITSEDAAAATRALAARAERVDPDLTTTAFLVADRDGRVFLDATRAGSATVVAAYSPRARPGVPVSFPTTWDALSEWVPGRVNVSNAIDILGDGDPWAASMPSVQRVPTDLIAEGRQIPTPRVAAMHEGKRRRRARDT